MNSQELTDFRGRCLAAKMYGRQVANAAAYATELENEAGPVPLAPGMKKYSAAHLVALADKVLRVRAGEEKPVQAKVEKKAEPKPEPEEEATPEPEAENGEEDPEPEEEDSKAKPKARKPKARKKS